MLIFTNKELHEQVLESKVYRNIYDNYKNYKKGNGSILNAIKSLGPKSISWTSWFKNHNNVCELLDKMEKYTESKNDKFIPIDIYTDLMIFLNLEEKNSDATVQALTSILKQVLKKEVGKAIGLVEYCLKSPSFTGHRGLCQNIDCLSYIHNKKFYTNASSIKAMGILLDALIKMIDSEEKRNKLAKDSHSEALKSIELALGRVADDDNPFHIYYITLVQPFLYKVQDTLREHGLKVGNSFKMDSSKIIK